MQYLRCHVIFLTLNPSVRPFELSVIQLLNQSLNLRLDGMNTVYNSKEIRDDVWHNFVNLLLVFSGMFAVSLKLTTSFIISVHPVSPHVSVQLELDPRKLMIISC